MQGGALVAGGSAQCQLQPAADDREFHNTIVTSQQCCTQERVCAHVCLHSFAQHVLLCCCACLLPAEVLSPPLCTWSCTSMAPLSQQQRRTASSSPHPGGKGVAVGGCVSSKQVGVARRLRFSVTPVFVSTLGFDSCHPQHDAALPCPAVAPLLTPCLQAAPWWPPVCPAPWSHRSAPTACRSGHSS